MFAIVMLNSLGNNDKKSITTSRDGFIFQEYFQPMVENVEVEPTDMEG